MGTSASKRRRRSSPRIDELVAAADEMVTDALIPSATADRGCSSTASS